MIEIKVSVIIIVYNQKDSLIATLNGFANQTVSKDDFELIVVDDGSTDNTQNIFSDDLKNLSKAKNCKIFHIKNSGRSHAKNVGIRNSKGKYLIFCDGDRIPGKDFIKAHLDMLEKNNSVISVGEPLDYYSKNIFEFSQKNLDKYSRLPYYPKLVFNLSESEDDKFYKNYYWALLLSGNAAFSKDLILKIGLYDETFRDWGFEHFEFGYRAWRKGIPIICNKKAKNYHIVHARNQNIEKLVEQNIKIIKDIHPNGDFDILRQLILNPEMFNY